MIVYKIFLKGDYQSLNKYGVSMGSDLDQKDGFIHLSTARQIEKTLPTHFASVSGVYLLGLKTKLLKELKWETSRDKELFPHLYGKIYSKYICSQLFLSKINNKFHVPKNLSRTHE